MKSSLFLLMIVAVAVQVSAQDDIPFYFKDSVTVQAHPSYNTPGKWHRTFFGENYRKEWAAPTVLPVIHLSGINGGLKPSKLGGGMQSKSLRLVDTAGREWVIRSVEKVPDALIPPTLRSTFARDWVDDLTSAQHPYSALIVPPIAHAVKIPHSTPLIGVVASDSLLGEYHSTFQNMIVLLEEREPLGDSDNSEKMKQNLQKDNDNRIRGKEMLRARMLDILIGDWDRHEDQWRWFDEDKGKSKTYVAIPRDRDQVFHLTQGIIPKIASRQYILPTLRNFSTAIKLPKWQLYKTRFVNAYPSMQLSRQEWKNESEKFIREVTDSVLEAALQRLPASAYQLRHDVLLDKLMSRRRQLPEAMDNYFRFIHKIVDIQTSDKNELVEITGTPDGKMRVRISKMNKSGEIKDDIMDNVYDPSVTRELRLYVRNGHDSIVVNGHPSSICLRIIGGADAKAYNILSSKKKIKLYDTRNESNFYGNSSMLRKHIHDDSLTTAFTPVNLYNIWMPMVTGGINRDDGLLFGLGFKFTRQEGFRKFPYAEMHQLVASHSFSTRAFKIKYNGEWTGLAGKADLVMQALIKAPNNTINFFGRGNETPFNKTGDYIRYYRTRYNTYQFDPALRWHFGKHSTLSAGPSLYYYRFDADDNQGRFINNVSMIGSYDSASVEEDKMHVGVAVQYTVDRRNNKIIPSDGYTIGVRAQAFKGTGTYARDYAQLIPELSFYKSFGTSGSVVFAERVGGTIGLGHPAFYQSAFIGGHENLLGFRQYRFAGTHSMYNNMELRVKLADVASYILPGQLGLTAFWDIGRVWEKAESSGQWHTGAGGGVYFAPASMIAFNLVLGYSKEGVYPYFTLGFRF